MKVVVFGSTGAVGRRVVHYLVQDNRVAQVAAISRSQPKELGFFALESCPASLSEKLQQVKLNFDNIDDASEAQKLGGFDAGVSCLGIYSSKAKNLDEFMKLEYEPNVKVATLCGSLGCKRWAYLSGDGVKQPTTGQAKPGMFQANFSFVKGCTELSLSRVNGFEATTSVRPAMILGREGEPQYGALDALANNMSGLLSSTSIGIMADDIAKAMAKSLFVNTNTLNEVLSNQEIKARANS